jgi:methylmalonyl-CoA mutase
MADGKEKLFSDFAPVTTEKWMEKVTADLKGADFEKKLVWKTNEGFKVKPFYRMEDLEGLKTTEALPGVPLSERYQERQQRVARSPGD